jgi:hypothetical protein
MSSDVRYHFGPRDRRGVLLGIRLGQIAILVTGAIVAMVVLLGAHGSGGGMLALLLVVGLTATAAFVPISGRALDEWLPTVLHFLLHGRRTWRSPQPRRGQVLRTTPGGKARVLAEQPAFPPVLHDCTILAIPVPRGELGVAKDARRGTWTAVLQVRGTSFALTDSGEKARRMGAWGAVQASLARRGTPISALQFVVRTLAEDPDALARHLAEQRTLDLHSPIVRSYLTLLDDAAPVAEAQEVQVLVALQVSLRSAGQQIRQAGGGDTGAGEVLSRQLHALQSQMQGADIEVEGALPPRLLAQTLREAWDPGATDQLRLTARHHPGHEGVPVSASGPLFARPSWRGYETDSALHTSYWISEWPRVPVGPGFLMPLLLQTRARMSVSVCMVPIDPIQARRDLEAQRTEHLADEQLRQRHGFRTSIDKERQAEGVERRESELADGHAEYRFSGHLTVSVTSIADMERACGSAEEHAALSCLDLRRMDGEHDRGFAATLPLARGIW